MKMRSGDFGPQLLKVLKKKGWTQIQLARRTNMTKAGINCIVHGRRDPGLETLLKILNVLEVPLEEIFYEGKA